VKRDELRESLGQLVTPMLQCMGTRGADSAGLAVFHEPLAAPQRRFGLFAGHAAFDWQSFHAAFTRDTASEGLLHIVDSHAFEVSSIAVDAFKAWLKKTYPAVHLISVGRSIEMYKDEGHPGAIAERFHFAELTGTHAVGHTRMATESAVSPAHAHPYTAGEDFCLVHNGSLSNPSSIRRKPLFSSFKLHAGVTPPSACSVYVQAGAPWPAPYNSNGMVRLTL
jgi:glutamate synthase domain-containing protein 1